MKIAIIFNEPKPDRYDDMGEGIAVASVMEEVKPVNRALRKLGHSTIRVPLSPPLDQVRNVIKALEADLIFNLFEGFDGMSETEAQVAHILEEVGIPFTGNPSAALALALDKPRAKAVLNAGGVRTPRYRVLRPDTVNLFDLNFPCIVKPAREDASHGLSEESVVNDFEQLRTQVHRVSQAFRGDALVEEFLEGREFNATVIGNGHPIVLPIAEMVYYLPPDLPKLLTFAAKWYKETPYYKGTKARCPAKINEETIELISHTAATAFTLIGCRGYARVDMRLDDEEIPNVLEVNPNPDISPGYGVARQARAAGMSYEQFIEQILEMALENQPCLQT
jgi:D-alanine-D-alanine ligase